MHPSWLSWIYPAYPQPFFFWYDFLGVAKWRRFGEKNQACSWRWSWPLRRAYGPWCALWPRLWGWTPGFRRWGWFPLMVPLYLSLDGENFHGKSQSMTLETSMCGLFFQLDLEQDSRSEMMAQLAWQDGFSTEGRNTIGYSHKITWLILKKNIKLFFVWTWLTLASLTQLQWMFHEFSWPRVVNHRPPCRFFWHCCCICCCQRLSRVNFPCLASSWSPSPPWGSWRQGKVRCWRYENTKTKPMNGWR